MLTNLCINVIIKYKMKGDRIMKYENKKIVAISKPISDYTKNYIVCVESSNFWVVYDETDLFQLAKSIVLNLEAKGEECIIIWNKTHKLK